MKFYSAVIPSALGAVEDATTGEVRYYKADSAAVAGLSAERNKVAGIQVSRHNGVSAFTGTDEAIQTALGQSFSVANQPVTFIPVGIASDQSVTWAGVTPGSQFVDSPIQVQINAAGDKVSVRVAPKWVKEFKGTTLIIACET